MSHVVDLLELTAFLLFFGSVAFFVGLPGMTIPKAFIRGWLAEDAGRGRNENPYLHGSIAFRAWDRGWRRSREVNP